MTDIKRMRLRYPGKCRNCNASLSAGTNAAYDRGSKTVVCLTCLDAADSMGAASIVASPQRPDPFAATSPPPTITPVVSDYGAAGASASREYHRRLAKDEARLRRKWGMLGGLAVAMSDERHSTRVWDRGAIGEQRVGSRLDPLRTEGIAVLHDRRIPGRQANIDHMVVTSGGVIVVDTKHYKGRPRLRVEGGFLRRRTELLMVGNRDCTSLVIGMLKQVEVVRRYAPGVPVRGVLCFVNADWPVFGGEFGIDGVVVTWPRRLVAHARASNAGDVDVVVTSRALAARFKPA